MTFACEILDRQRRMSKPLFERVAKVDMSSTAKGNSTTRIPSSHGKRLAR